MNGIISNVHQPMTLGNMRANGVRTLAAWCLSGGCDRRDRALKARQQFADWEP
jgi:hypothetical protein